VTAFIDTNIWVYALTTADKVRQQRAAILLNSLDMPCINGQVLRELGRVLLQKYGIGEIAFRQIIPIVIESCRMVPDTTSALLLASKLREQYKLGYWDSLIVAAALDGGCDSLYTEDMQHGQIIESKITLINPFVGK
jgi:predicted nucleic acid-binding protein